MFILLQLSLLFLQVQGLPSGAPAQACSAIYPVGHGGSSQGLQNNPFSLDMAVFDELGGTIYYVPEATYEGETTLHRTLPYNTTYISRCRQTAGTTFVPIHCIIIILCMLGAVCLSGSGAQFRGFLVQARSVADESPVGSFTASGTGQRLSSCTTPEVSAQNKEKNISYSERHRRVC